MSQIMESLMKHEATHEHIRFVYLTLLCRFALRPCIQHISGS